MEKKQTEKQTNKQTDSPFSLLPQSVYFSQGLCIGIMETALILRQGSLTRLGIDRMASMLNTAVGGNSKKTGMTLMAHIKAARPAGRVDVCANVATLPQVKNTISGAMVMPFARQRP